MSKGRRVGPTGEYPQGKYTEDDEGELNIALAADPRNGKVLMHFGKPIVWLGMSPEDAEALAVRLIAKAREARGVAR